MTNHEFDPLKKQSNDDTIYIVSQYFYGNRTGTTIARDEVEYFVRVPLADYESEKEEFADLDIRIIPVPCTDNLVILYDQTAEDRYINIEFPEHYAEYGSYYKEKFGEEYTMHVACYIPEIDFTIHTRCIACRIDENGVYQSLQGEDFDYFMHYFTK
ncbi:MAG: hypothetical protein Q4B73_10320 [Lachnospiraceae bacterium]|nr:hypothetical protein [Lachnospiraceae bacterium]